MILGKKLLFALSGSVLAAAALTAAEAEKTEKAAASQEAAQAAVAAMNAPQTIPVEEAFAFLPETVATLDGKPVSRAEFFVSIKENLPEGGLPAGSFQPEQLKIFAPILVEQFLQQKLLDQEIAKSGMTASAAEVEKMIREELAAASKEQMAMLEASLKARGETVDGIIAKQAADPRAQKMVLYDKWFKANVKTEPVTEADAKKYYDENPARFVKPGDPEGSIRASHILVKADDTPESQAAAKAKIEAIAKRVAAGEDFGKIAEEVSDCPSGKQNKGSLGAFQKGQMVPEFEAAAFALNVGQVSAPVKTQFGWHLIRRDASEGPRPIAFEDVKNELIAGLDQQRQNEAMKACFTKMMADHKAEVLVKAPEPPKAPAAKPAAAPAQ